MGNIRVGIDSGFTAKRPLLSVVLMCVMGIGFGFLQGCGQKGDLYLPPPVEPVTTESTVSEQKDFEQLKKTSKQEPVHN